MGHFGFLKDPLWLKTLFKEAFGGGFFGFLIFAVAMGGICYWLRGYDIFYHALIDDLVLISKTLPRVMMAMSVAALVWVMLPRKYVSNLGGRQVGISGLIIAALAGAITPGGPSSAYALLAMLGLSGAERGAMVSYITAWALLGVQRILLWDVPFLGVEFALLRILCCLPLPIIAGLVARRLPFKLVIKAQKKNEVSD